jgi:hypothetical protein
MSDVNKADRAKVDSDDTEGNRAKIEVDRARDEADRAKVETDDTEGNRAKIEVDRAYDKK